MRGEQKYHYIECLRAKYNRSSKKQKGEILTEVQKCLSVTRKHAIRLLSKRSVGRPNNPAKRGRRPKYQDPEFKAALRGVWKTSRYMCSRLLKEAIPTWLPYIEAEQGKYPEDIRIRLLSISPPTMDRILKPYKANKGKSLTSSAGFRDEIPIQENIWDIQTPGFIETDTVAHCGGSVHGEFVNTLTVVDIASLWTEARAVFGKGANPVFSELKNIESELPFEILGYDADNGGEVLNKQILSYFTEERLQQGREPVQVTRSRAYKKNDNAHVEQRNDSIARRYLGYERFDCKDITELINFYYQQIVCPLHNHFFPTFKLSKKIRIKSRTRRVYAKPLTPYTRIINSEHISEEYKRKLRFWHNELNPLALLDAEKKLRKQIDTAAKKLRASIPLSKKDLALPLIFQRPVFDDRPNEPILYQTTQTYAHAKNLLKGFD